MPESIVPLSTPKQRSLWSWLRDRLFPRGTKLIFLTSYVILVAMLILYMLNPPTGAGQFQFYSTLLALSVLLVINIVWDDLEALFPQEVMGSWVLLIVSTTLTFYVLFVGQMWIAVYVLFMVIAQVNVMLPYRPAIAFSVLVNIVYFGLLILSGATLQLITDTGLGILIGMVFTITLSQVLLRYSEQTERANQLLEQLQQANSELLEARQREKELIITETIAEERVRVARDLHDGLGHHLMALSIQLQAAEKLVRTKPETAEEAVRNARGEVQAALKEVRQSVAALRETPVDIHNMPQTITDMVNGFGKRTRLNARFTLRGTPANLSPAAAMTLYRTAQEGLTNVQKHAQDASQVTVQLAYETDAVRLLAEDDGKAAECCPEPLSGSKGFGLDGLRERAQLLSGSMECGRRPDGGFFISIVLPVQEADHDARAVG